MSAAYDAVDQMAGNRKIVPITMYRNQAQAIRMVLPANEVPRALDMIADAPAELKLTFRQAHDLRTMFRDMARRGMNNLTPTIRTHRLLEAAGEANEALDSIADTETISTCRLSLKTAGSRRQLWRR